MGLRKSKLAPVSTRGKDRGVRTAEEALWCGLVPRLLFWMVLADLIEAKPINLPA